MRIERESVAAHLESVPSRLAPHAVLHAGDDDVPRSQQGVVEGGQADGIRRA